MASKGKSTSKKDEEIYCIDCNHCFNPLDKFDLKINKQSDGSSVLPNVLFDIIHASQCLASQASRYRNKVSGSWPLCIKMRNDFALIDICGENAKWFKKKK